MKESSSESKRIILKMTFTEISSFSFLNFFWAQESQTNFLRTAKEAWKWLNGTSVSNGTRPSPINISHRGFRNFPESFGKWKMPRKNSHRKKKTLNFKFFLRERGGGSHCFCLQHSVLSPQLLMFLSFSKKMWEFYEFKLRVWLDVIVNDLIWHAL